VKEFKMPETCPITASGIFLKNGQQAMILSGKLAHYSAGFQFSSQNSSY
jgi:hypothetical protein